jgi:mRNA-degrading endonuclease toxin of MazEF toxin-antitoxin module
LVPFPFTDLSGRKRRPALVVSPEGFDGEDLILCAITSQLPRTPSDWEVPLEARDMADDELPKKSIVKAGKLFTMHERLVAARYGAVKEQKLQEVLEALRGLFALERATDGSGVVRPESGQIDEAVLALLWLNAFDDHGQLRSWKTFDWDAMDRLHERGLISNPKSKAKSVVLTEEGRHAAEQAFRRKFAS